MRAAAAPEAHLELMESQGRASRRELGRGECALFGTDGCHAGGTRDIPVAGATRAARRSNGRSASDPDGGNFRKTSDGKMADEREKALLAQIRELTRQLDKEKNRKKEQVNLPTVTAILSRAVLAPSNLPPGRAY